MSIVAEKKEKRYVSDNARLMEEWDWEKNNESNFSPDVLTLGSNKKVWWKCSEGHKWDAVIASRSVGYGCPYCSGRFAIEGFNDLQTVNPVLSMQWNYEKNIGLSPTDVMSNSGKKVWWICPEGHEWQAKIANRNHGCGCPYCSGQKVLTGYNDLQTINPNLVKEWNFDKNKEITPVNAAPNSNKKVWWKCPKGHEWQATVAHRNGGTGCPYCSNKKVLKGYNDLQTVNPVWVEEWNQELNGDLKPENYTVSSGKMVWWKCKKGHEWKATINDRNNGGGCPICNHGRKTSFPEYALLYYLKKHGLETVHSYKENGYELDIYIPSLKVAVEYDGYYWHKDKKKNDLTKNRMCKRDGIKLYRIREELPSLFDSSLDYVVQKNQKDLPIVLQNVVGEIIGSDVDIDLKRDFIAIENTRDYVEKERTLLLLNPQIAADWNYQKNGSLKPENYTVSSGKKVWWKCDKGHEWQATIANRNGGTGCPYCSNNKVLSGYNDLQTLNPILAAEWNYEKNGSLIPLDILPNSSKKAWWKCSYGHEWQAAISSRNRGKGCPYCSGRFATKGENDLLTSNSYLANEWNYEKNDGLTPSDVLPNSNKKVWWKCRNGHEWQAIIANRNKRGDGCPVCRKKH